MTSRLPNSTAWCQPASAPGVGTMRVPSQVGQSEQPSPDPVTRTTPPVTTIATLATTAARATRTSVGWGERVEVSTAGEGTPRARAPTAVAGSLRPRRPRTLARDTARPCALEDPVAIDTTPAPPTPTAPAVDARTHGRRGLVLMAFAVWNLWLWGTRVQNMLTGDEGRSAGFIAVHLVLYGVSTVLAIAIGVMGWRMRREARP